MEKVFPAYIRRSYEKTRIVERNLFDHSDTTTRSAVSPGVAGSEGASHAPLPHLRKRCSRPSDKIHHLVGLAKAPSVSFVHTFSFAIPYEQNPPHARMYLSGSFCRHEGDGDDRGHCMSGAGYPGPLAGTLPSKKAWSRSPLRLHAKPFVQSLSCDNTYAHPLVPQAPSA